MKFSPAHIDKLLQFDSNAALLDAILQIHQAFRDWGVPSLIGPVKVAWNERLTSTAGRAGNKEIELSYHLWIHMSPEDRRNTAVHEAAHIAMDKIKFSAAPHGYQWKRLMLHAGESPDRCHKLNTKQLLYGKQQDKYQCGCGEEITIGPTQAKRIRKGAKYRCRYCRRVIKLEKL